MGKTLVLAEKPSVAREIARVLGCNQKGNGHLSGGKYIVTWALGHLVTLADPETYGEKYKKWDLETLPMLPKKMELVVIKETAGQFNTVRGLMKREDVDELVIATDSGREGELVARWIIEKAGFRKPIKRLWISSQTDKAIKDGFSVLKPGRDYENLFRSAQSRAEADWLVGLNVTRALTCKHNAQLSAGRVQTPTLAMIVDREEEIRRFQPKDFWQIQAFMDGFSLRWQEKASGQTRIFDKARAESITQALAGKKGTVIELHKSARQELPPLAYDLTELQRDANRRFGFSAKQTLSIMQRLYEHYKLVTYPRTDSRHITDDMVPTLTDRLKSISVGPYAQAAGALIKNRFKVTKRLVDNSKVTDHHAILPTEQFVDLNALSIEERRVYDLIVKRFLAVLSPSFDYDETSVKVDIGGELFTAKGRMVRSQGWRAVYEGFDSSEDEDDEDPNREKEKDQTLPELKKGDSLTITSVKTINGKTKPPARYTEATLLTAMEHPGKFVEDSRLKQALEATSGLGTPATRADIIEKLFDTFYVERKGKEIFPTSKGIQLIKLVPEDLKSPSLTAKWEQKLTAISRGQENGAVFVEEMKKYATSLVGAVIANSENYRHDNVTREKCPECGKFLLDVNGKKGKMLVCPDRECGYRKSVSLVSNARCPECHKKMEIRGEGENKAFFCVCGHKEKLEAFNKRKNEQVSKRDVSSFLNKQQDEGINSALAEALSKWKK